MTRGLILAAGLGLRLRPLTDHRPKCLVPVAGRPLLDYWVDALVACGVREALVNTHAHAEQVRAYVAGVNGRGGIRLVEAHEPRLLGSAGTIAANPGLAGDGPVVVVSADNFSDVDLGRMLRFHATHGDPATMMLFHTDTPHRCGIARLDADGRVAEFVEKPAHPVGTLANAGVYVMDAALYARVAAMDAFDLGTDVLPGLVGAMRGWTWDGYHRDLGTPEAYAQGQADAPAVLVRLGRAADGTRPCVFLDRDGTLLEFVHYLSDPAQVRLAADAPAAIRRLRERGFACVVVTNQAQVGRGALTAGRLDEIHEEMLRQLAAAGVMVDGVYTCPAPGGGGDRTRVEHPDRKPGPGMLRRAARDLGLALDRSWMVGDMVSDVLAGENAGCRGSVLLPGPAPATEDEARAAGRFPTARTLAEAVDRVLEDAGP